MSSSTNRPKAVVSLAQVERDASPSQIQAATWRVAEAASDFSWLSPGDTVFIKPVINSGNPYPATTSPPAVAAMVGLLKEKGAGRILVGDMGGIAHVKQRPEGVKGSTRGLAMATGLAQAAEEAGAELHFFEEAGWDAFFEDHPAPGSHWKGGLMLPMVLRQVDHIVLMPRCSRHALLGSTLGLKAVVGYMRFDTRLEYHRHGAHIQEMTAEANTVGTLRDKQRLVVSAADKILANYGPDKGLVLTPEVGLVMASTSVTAHDLMSLAWLILNRRTLSGGQLGMFSDPNSSQLVANLANHMVAGMLGGAGAALTAQALTRQNLASIGQDRILARAFQVLGGVPEVKPLLSGPELNQGLVNDLMGVASLGVA
ncbi:MAG: DUF362 domain-containing protein [Proteobacteria bacterium]|nr:DUF362 domain-containing protein [Pseudomonadota bacterium]MBU4385303.1 DUF362 domain-containing protein [Pseudomonadota bacterium]MBU4605420.1 DUF362 domain-containing protein [Pseudomonadota bacterium]MCG2764567.1 DUF362 domain-containing protein [Desulfarculaceae bacterium]